MMRKRFSIQSSNGDYLTIADGTNVGTVPLVHTRLEGRDLFEYTRFWGKESLYLSRSSRWSISSAEKLQVALARRCCS